MLSFSKYLEEGRTLEGVELHTERKKGYTDVHHVHLNGKHIASIHPSSTGLHSKDEYSVYKPPIKNPDRSTPSKSTFNKHGDPAWDNSFDDHGYGHPNHRESKPSEIEVPSGEKGFFGGKKYKKVMGHKAKKYVSLHQAVRETVKKHKENN